MSGTRAARVTIHDIARELGISPSTVSRALSEGGVVSPATRQAVQDAAQQLGYETNRAARSMSLGRMHGLGLIVPDLRDPFFAEIAKDTQSRARVLDTAVYIADTDRDPAAELDVIRSMRREVDGFVVCAPRSADDALTAALDGAPSVIVHRSVDGFACITADLVDGMRQAIAHLRAIGHRRIAHVTGPAGSWSTAERLRGYELEVEPRDRIVIGPNADAFEGGVAAAERLLAAGATAVVTYNDFSALGLLSRLTALQVRIPQDLSIVGFDGLDVASVARPLTSVDVPRARAARMAVDVLLREAPGPQSSVVLPTQLIVRATTGPAPSQ
ncbi:MULTISPECIES: LacI family DNA-binding transcriptional regulator [Kribbella]|uniref:LacI family DNA-binding transcriptional regulator n=1 Tax=Kribbella karoonensis TaxID=324851 RepID=A0ABN2E3V2_9ACTN